jgi:hypothetical protein
MKPRDDVAPLFAVRLVQSRRSRPGSDPPVFAAGVEVQVSSS